MKKMLLLCTFTVIFAVSAYADVRLPDNLKPSPVATPKSDKNENRVNFQMGVSSNFDEPTLVVPRNAIKDLRAQLDQVEGSNQKYAGTSAISGTQTLMSGLFFSVALIFGGVWIFRGKSPGKNQKVISGFLIFAFLGASGVLVFANVAPPILQSLNSNIFSHQMKTQRRMASGKVKVEIVDSSYEGAPIKLYIPRNDSETNRNDEE